VEQIKINHSFTVHAPAGVDYVVDDPVQIDRNVAANIDRLVLTCEELLQREQQA
jgi:tRNA nucleotidyltransferase (CCA-adding enzyme)